MILAIYPDDDLHGVRVGQRFQELGAEYLQVDASRLHEQQFYALNPLGDTFCEGEIFLSLGQAAAQRTSIKFQSIYWRRPWLSEQSVALRFPTSPQLPAAEACHTLRLAVETLPEQFFPLGHPVQLEAASNKLRQLAVAKRLGFMVPATIVGNDGTLLREFLAQHERVVVKPLHSGVSWQPENRELVDQLLWCRGLAAANLLERLQEGQKAQLLIQAAVQKRQDWRITVLPHTSICCEIETAGLTADQPDWRKLSDQLPHRIIPLTPAFDQQLRRYLQELHLKAGYFDFAVGPDGVPVFLEVNTNANWLWIEEATGFPISTEIAKCFLSAVS